MRIRKVILPLVIALALVASVGAVGAWFSDVETVGVHDIQAGTLDLTVDDENPCTVHITVENIAPGWSETWTWELKNIGSIPGAVSVEFGPITNVEGGVTEPEADAEDDLYGYEGARATLGHPTDGELGEYLKPTLTKNDPWGFFGPGSVWSSGPFAYGKPYGLNSLGGQTYDAGVTLGQDGTIAILLKLSLDTDLTAWDGCNSHDINDNVIQSDSVEFDITFHLDQVQP